MSYWFDNPIIKMLLPLAGATAIQGLSLNFRIPQIFLGYNVFGAGIGGSSIDTIGAKCPRKRAFIVTDEFSERFSPIVIRAFAEGGFETEIWNKALPEVPVDNVKECGEAMTQFQPDVIVALGGGSVMDGAKVAWILYEKPEVKDIYQISPLEPLGLRKKAILVAIPTTSGTGSECTSAAVVHDVKTDRKIPLSHKEIQPDFAILYPEFTHTMPPKLTVGTGLDVLAHSMDSVMSASSHEFANAFNIPAIKLAFQFLPRAYRNGNDREARYRMLMASTFAGIGFGSAPCALTHSFGHSIGSLFNIHHGLAVGFFIPFVFEFYRKVSDKYLRICDAFKIEGKSKEERFDGLMEKIRSLFKELDVPSNLRDLGIEKSDFEQKMEKLVLYTFEDIDTFFSPRPITMVEVEKILRHAYEGKSINF